MKHHKSLALFLIVFFSVLGGYLLSYANFSQNLPNNLTGKNEVYAKEANNDLALDNPNFAQLQAVFRAVPSKILPSVVQIDTSSTEEVVGNPQNLFFRFFGQPEQEDPPKREYQRVGMGSGSIIQQEGNTYYVLTNNHVINDADDIEVTTYDGHKFPAEVVGHDERVDLGVIKFTPNQQLDSLKVAELGDSSALKIGDLVMAVGSPDYLQSTVTQGIVSYIGRHGGPGGNINDFIQTDASINRGNSGGPLVDMNGQIIGINTWIASESGASAGLGFAIPINNAKFAIDSFLQEGELSYGWLGVTLPPYLEIVERLGNKVTKEVLSPMGIYGKKGSLVGGVFSNSPADKSGIKPGDYLIEINGKPIESSEELTLTVGMLRPGQKANFRLIRAGQEREVSVTLDKRQSADELAKNSDDSWPGIMVLPLNNDINQSLRKMSNGRMDTEETSGLLVLNVTEDSAVQVVGIKEGDVITKINGAKVNDLAEFYRELNENSLQNTVFTYKRKGYELETPKIKLK